MKKHIFLFLTILMATRLWGQNDTDNYRLNAIDDHRQADTLAVTTDSIGDMSLPADSLPWPLCMQARLDSLLLHPMFQTSTVALMVYDLTDDSTLYSHNHRLLLRPASTMKLLTAITAIDRLGSEHPFSTSLYYKGSIDNRTLRGDLFCVGGMDPLFDEGDLQAFIDELHRLGVDTIRGRIVADRTMKDTLRWGEGWCWDDDNPTLSPLLVNRKADFMERFISLMASQDIVPDSIYLTDGRLPAGATLVCTRSHSIGEVLETMMKDSNNLFAESMLYHLAASDGNPPATARKARALERDLIRRTGLNPMGYRLADGSGLSLYNYLSAELEVMLLRYAWSHHRVFDLLYPSLPIAGEDGTLKQRLQSPFTSGNVRAKTGTLTGVSSLAGYCTAPNGHFLCFCIINQGVMRPSVSHQFQERVCIALCQP